MWTGRGLILFGPSRGASPDHLRGSQPRTEPELKGGGLTRVRLVALGHGDVAVVGRVGKDDGTNHAVVLGILNLETPKDGPVADEGNLALEVHAEVYQPLKVCASAASASRQLTSSTRHLEGTHPT